MTDRSWLDQIDIVGGHPATDFVNTVSSWAVAQPRDYLRTPAHLVSWCLDQGLIDTAQARAMQGLTPEAGERLLREAQRLRKSLYALFSAHIDGRENASALVKLNRTWKKLSVYRALADSAGEFSWRYRVLPEVPDSLLSPVAFSAAALLTSPELARLKICPPPEGCNWIFVDRSRNGSRTWCSMKTCGNTAKVRRYRVRRERDA